MNIIVIKFWTLNILFNIVQDKIESVHRGPVLQSKVWDFSQGENFISSDEVGLEVWFKW
jgi:hypothetical protein